MSEITPIEFALCRVHLIFLIIEFEACAQFLSTFLMLASQPFSDLYLFVNPLFCKHWFFTFRQQFCCQQVLFLPCDVSKLFKDLSANHSLSVINCFLLMSPNPLILNWFLYTDPPRQPNEWSGFHARCGVVSLWWICAVGGPYSKIHLCLSLYFPLSLSIALSTQSVPLSRSHFLSFFLSGAPACLTSACILNHQSKPRKRGTKYSWCELIFNHNFRWN